MMKAFVVDRYGRKNGVRAGDMPVPEIREDDAALRQRVKSRRGALDRKAGGGTARQALQDFCCGDEAAQDNRYIQHCPASNLLR